MHFLFVSAIIVIITIIIIISTIPLLQHVGLNKAAWRLLASYVTRWAHRLPVVSSWHACLASASTLLLRQLKKQHSQLAKQHAKEYVLEQKQWRRGEGPEKGERKGGARTNIRKEEEESVPVFLFWPLHSARKAGGGATSASGLTPSSSKKKATKSADNDDKKEDDSDFLNGYEEDLSEGEDESVLAEVCVCARECMPQEYLLLPLLLESVHLDCFSSTQTSPVACILSHYCLVLSLIPCPFLISFSSSFPFSSSSSSSSFSPPPPHFHLLLRTPPTTTA